MLIRENALSMLSSLNVYICDQLAAIKVFYRQFFQMTVMKITLVSLNSKLSKCLNRLPSTNCLYDIIIYERQYRLREQQIKLALCFFVFYEKQTTKYLFSILQSIKLFVSAIYRHIIASWDVYNVSKNSRWDSPITHQTWNSFIIIWNPSKE